MRPVPSVVAVVFVLASLSGCAQKHKPDIRWLGITDVGADVELEFEGERRERKEKSGRAELTTDDRLFTETLNLDVEGYVYHPRLLQLSAALGLILEQGESSVDQISGATVFEQSGSRSAETPQYEIEGVFLAEHPVSLSLGALRTHSTISPAFGDLAILDSHEEHAELSLKHRTFPTRIYASQQRSETDQIGVGDDREDEEVTLGVVVNYDGNHSTAEFNYEFIDSSERTLNTVDPLIRTDIDRTEHNALLTHEWRFGAEDEHRLASRLQYRDETGTFPRRRLLIDENLSLKHRETLSSDYVLRYTSEGISGLDTDILYGHAGLRHRLFESLVTNVQVHGQRETFGSDGRDIHGASIDLDYRKRIPHGTLFVTLGGEVEMTDEKADAIIERTVHGERHTLSDAKTVLLKQRGIDLRKLFVTDERGRRTYRRGTDFLARPLGPYMQLRRVPSGAIPDGSTILVTYTFISDNALEYLTKTLNGRVQLDLFDHLSLYVSRLSIRNRVRDGFDEGRLESLDDTLYGASVTWEPATLTAEHQDYDSSIAPFETDEVRLDVQQRFRRIHTVAGHAIYRRVAYGEGGTSLLRSVSGSYQVAPARWPSVEVSGGYSRVEDRGFDEELIYAEIETDYHVRATEFALEYRVEQRDDSFARELTHYLLVSVRREF